MSWKRLHRRQFDFAEHCEAAQIIADFNQIDGGGIQNAGDFDKTVGVSGGFDHVFRAAESEPGYFAQFFDNEKNITARRGESGKHEQVGLPTLEQPATAAAASAEGIAEATRGARSVCDSW